MVHKLKGTSAETARLECLSAWATARGGHILVVDDSEPNRIVAATMLARSGFTAETASDGDEAVALAGCGRFDLILMDLAMPGRNGLDATRAIRAMPPPVDTVPIVAVSANVALVDEQVRCREAGMDDCLAKPFNRHQLLGAVARWLGGPGSDARLDGAAVEGLRRDLGQIAFAQVVSAFLGESWRLAGRMTVAARDGDLDTVLRTSQTLQEAACACGADDVGRMAAAIRQAAVLGDRGGVLDECTRLAPVLNATADRLTAIAS
ncbi:response regulator [Arenibaculum sp.]|uniref:response regulator n=1 Tax=Arenibaculum sp. TaxID=2865862 RepID=UPI002E0F375D|nr:response regulator [Arenibaculum sp.]